MIADTKPLITPEINVVTDAIIYQLMNVMGLKKPNWITRCLYPLFRPPAQHMSRLLVDLDRNIAQHGWNLAVNQFLGNFISEVQIQNAEAIPKQGPLMVVGNHPAAYDIAILITAIQREDLKILHSDIPLAHMLPNIAKHGIPVPYNIPSRLQTVRITIQHLNNAGSVFIFPRGNVEPDPAITPGAEASLDGWSSSLELFLRRVPQTVTVVAISSGILSAKWFNNPVIKLWKTYEQRQKVAEIFQILTQLITRKKPATTPLVSFSPALSVEELGGQDAPEGTLLSNIIEQARCLLADHPHA
jgi:hypothetical protein